jgi:glyoxylase-like metal-dependent hydrolase (beta-lactamase superfamily II)
MVATRLTDQLYHLSLGSWQAYLWRDPGGATLIDTGAAGSGSMIKNALDSIGLRPSDLGSAVLTHFHDDHAGGAAEVASWGVPITAHTADAPVIRGDVQGPPPNFTEFERELHRQVATDLPPAPPVRVDREVTDGDVLDFGGGAVIISTPGHTDGSIAVHLPHYGVLFTGDIAAEHEGKVILGVFNLDTDTAAESLRKIATVDADIVCFGHGRPLLEFGTRQLREVRLPTGD